MWRSSSKTSAARRRRRPARGFSLMELIASLAIYSVVIAVPMYLLFTMRNYAERQQFTIIPRQAARRAVDYMSYYLEGASDQNALRGNPNAVVTWYNSSSFTAASRVQASYNNLTAGQAGSGYGDEGTDIISLSIPSNPMKIPIVQWLGDGPHLPFEFSYKGGCPDDAANLAAFRAVTGATGTPPNERSGILTAVDAGGEWRYFVITSYDASDCASITGANIHVQASPGQAPANSLDGGPIDPPGGHVVLAEKTTLVLGGQFVSFRVRNGNLEQKNGIFFPVDYPTGVGNADTPGTAFFTIAENIEDLQIAYMYADGTIWNTANQTLNMAGECVPEAVPIPCGGNVPWQGYTTTITPPAHDITRVVGLRLTVVGRSAPMSLGVRKMTTLAAAPHIRPAVEDHLAGTPDNFEHYRITTTIMLRNRMLGY